MSDMLIPRQFVCTNPNCRMFKEKLVRIVFEPAYAKVVCDECGHVMSPRDVLDTEVVFISPEGPESNVLSSGFLPIQEEKSGILAWRAKEQARLQISDPDIDKYPDISLVRQNPNCVHPNLLHVLQTSMVVLVRDKGSPRSALLIRAPSHYMSSSITDSTRLSLHVEVHEIAGVDMYGIYPLIWDNPHQPFFAETKLVPYDSVGIPEVELASPIYYGFEWRKLFYLLTQNNAEFILMDEQNHILLAKIVSYAAKQRVLFMNLARGLAKYKGKQVTHSQTFQLHTTYNKAVNMDEIRRRFLSMDGCYMESNKNN